jgi:hypothetical protein
MAALRLLQILQLVALLVTDAYASDFHIRQSGERLLAAVQQSTCGTAGLDLSSLSRTAGPDYQYATPDLHYTWYVNVCANTLAPCPGSPRVSPAVWN